MKTTGARLRIAPAIAQKKNTFDGENLSAIVNVAKVKVPKIKPNCTAEVILPNDPDGSDRNSCKSGSTALPANQSEVPANCAMTITGRM
ncbi:hypothetical protein C900_04124 [Fulvivirga imtechensis AK7]|uniref:Uncharacterized protein n=1 Tax=Fulvivirga imtechensis AK7 TaxID=1237149 RepID=L8JRE2_9BACT|nr:hypothetical protein C900_04124 [Fulvivirga imtechensis AK7]